MLKNLTIAQKFILLAAVMSIIMALMTVLTTVRLNVMAHHIHAISTADMPLTKQIMGITEHQLVQEIHFERAFRFALAMKSDRKFKVDFEHAVTEYDNSSLKITQEIAEIHSAITTHDSNSDDMSRKAQYAKLFGEMSRIKRAHKGWSEHAKKVLTLLDNGNYSQAIASSHAVVSEVKTLEELVIKTLDMVEVATEKSIISLEQEEANILTDGVIFTVVGIILGVVYCVFNLKVLNIDISKLNYSVMQINNGNLSTTFKSKSASKEIGLILENIDGLRANLADVMRSIHISGDESATVANHLNHLTSDVLENINKQNSEVDTLATAMAEMDRTSSLISDNAESTKRSTIETTELTVACQEDMAQAMTAMDNLTDSIERSSKNVLSLEEHGKKIGSVLDVIKSIADQTNLLALNAAIEAARAGKQGRGFAVVADEVRTLAQRTQESTTLIESMINGFASETSSVVKAMDDSQSYAKVMLDTAHKSNDNIAKISDAIGDVSGMTVQITQAGQQQVAVVSDISGSVNLVNELSNMNLSASEQVSKSNDKVEGISAELLEKISYFKV